MDINERFIIIEQTKPIHYLTIMKNGECPSRIQTFSLRWEVIDRGHQFVPLAITKTDSKFEVVARFADITEADAFRNLLIKIATVPKG